MTDANNTLHLAVIEDDKFFLALVKSSFEILDNVEVHDFLSAETFFAYPDISQFQLVFVDYELPTTNGIELLKEIKKRNQDIEIALLSGQKKIDVVVEAYKQGAYRYIIKNENALIEGQQCINDIRKRIQMKRKLEALEDEVIVAHKYENIIGQSTPMRKVFRLMEKVENVQMPVLVTGENGTGKELVAKALHFNSNRKRQAFIAVNVAAIPEDLIESELFGSEKGAYTGAIKRSGKFEEAHKGTIFLDEIGEMSLPLQAKLLRVLQENKVCRLGGSKEIDLDIKIVSATNKNLWDEVQKGNFREDLYFRLQGFIIELPPLRERGNDIILLAQKFVSSFCKKQKMAEVTIGVSAIKAMLDYQWPGNVRELKSMMERATLICDGAQITDEDLIFLNNSQTHSIAV